MSKFGSLLDLGDIRNYLYKNFPHKSKDVLPKEYKVKNTVLNIKDQKEFNACVGFACSSLIEIFNRLEFGNTVAMSPFYIYGKHRNYKDEGMYLGRTLHYLMSEGTVSSVDFSDEGEMPEIQDKVKKYVEIHPEMIEIAKKFKIGGYVDLISNDEKNKKENIKRSLFDFDYPIIAVTDHFGGYHCVLIDGWKDDIFYVPNSWGYDNGDNGYDEISQDSIVEAYLVIDEKSANLDFEDLTENHPLFKEIKSLYFTGVLEPDSEKLFNPDREMTKAEVAKAIYNNNKIIQGKIDKIFELISSIRPSE